MIHWSVYCANIELVKHFSANLPMEKLSIVECGTWRGGMTFGILEVVPECRNIHMFDSFEGVPVPGEKDGTRAQELYNEKLLVAERNVAGYEGVLKTVSYFGYRDRVTLHKGWFEETVSPEAVGQDIGILRLDGDWYDSTIVILERLFDRVVPGGVVIVDDYYSWAGCSQAVHNFLSRRQAPEVLRVWRGVVPYIVKLPSDYLSIPLSDAERERLSKKAAIDDVSAI